LGTGWFLLMNFVVSPWFPILEDSSLCQYLRIKDSSHIPDIIGFEYTNSREARNSSKSGNEKVSKD
jgi:dolichyldiphosphatase